MRGYFFKDAKCGIIRWGWLFERWGINRGITVYWIGCCTRYLSRPTIQMRKLSMFMEISPGRQTRKQSAVLILWNVGDTSIMPAWIMGFLFKVRQRINYGGSFNKRHPLISAPPEDLEKNKRPYQIIQPVVYIKSVYCICTVFVSLLKFTTIHDWNGI